MISCISCVVRSSTVCTLRCGVVLFGIVAGLGFILATAPVGLAQSGACLVVADSLGAAHDLYESHCSEPRQDCDPVSGRWYCSSQNIPNSGVPAGAYSGEQAGSNQSNSSGSSSNNNSGADNAGSGSAGSGVCVDPDGDGWGWNGASCRVSGSTGNTTNTGAGDTGNGSSGTGGGTSSSESQSGANCVDPDGDGWGWDGSASCRVSSAANSGAGNNNNTAGNNTSDASNCVDPDGDGWGWNGSSSCRVAVRQPSNNASNESNASTVYRSSDITDLVLLTGQSNALGASTDYDSGLDSPDKQVFAFTSNGWQVADLHQIWDRGWHPRNDPNTDPSNNLLLHFGKRLVSRDRNRVVGFVLVSEPGAAIVNWDYNSEFYRKMENRVLDAINQLPHKSQLDGVLWHQGETDANDTAYYTNKLNALISNLRSENWYSSGKPFICGEIAKRGGVNNRLNRLNTDNDAYTACVSAAGLSTRIDGSHFDAEGLRELGKRYADRYYSMTD